MPHRCTEVSRSQGSRALRALLAFAVAMTLLGQAPRAYADDTARAKAHYLKGKEYLAADRLEDAVREFKRAYLIKRIPAILFNVAQIYRRMNENGMALHFFEKFLQEAPPNDPNRKEAQAIIDTLRAGGTTPSERPRAEPVAPPTAPPRVERAPERREAPPPPPRRRARPVDVFTHEPVDEVPPDLPLDVTCRVPDLPDLRVTLFYRIAGHESFTPVVMKPRLGEYVGRIPARALGGKSLQYYIEARGETGKAIGSSGTPANPNIVLISTTAKAHYYAEMGEGRTGADFVPAAKPKPPREGQPRDYRVYKWIATAAAVGLAAGAGVMFYTAKLQSDSLEEYASRRDGSLPREQFKQAYQDMEANGKLNTTLGIACVVGAGLVAVGAGLLFHYDEAGLFEAPPRGGEYTGGKVSLAPVIDTKGGGLAARVRF